MAAKTDSMNQLRLEIRQLSDRLRVACPQGQEAAEIRQALRELRTQLEQAQELIKCLI